MRKLFVVAFTVLASAGAVSGASAEVRLTIQRGHVTLVAKDATIRQILAEWERVGQTKVMNAERIADGRVTLDLTDVPEQQALDVVLRSVSVVLAPRAVTDGNVSAFARIVVVPTSTGSTQVVATPPPPAFGPPPFPPQAPFPASEQDGPLAGPGAVFTYPPVQPTNPVGPNGLVNPPPLFPPQPAPSAPLSFGGVPGPNSSTPAGASVPGMVLPAPTPPPQGPPRFPLQPMP